MRSISTLVVLFVALVTLLPAVGASRVADTRAVIEQRLEQRYPQILAEKRQGNVGETWQGLVEIVDPSKAIDSAIKALIERENADRRALYEIIAAETAEDGVKVTAAQVGERNGQRNFRRAKPAEYFKSREGVWIQREDVDELREAGKIGETWQGTVDAVKPEFAADSKVAAVVAQENRLRTEQYAHQAHKENKSARQIAEQAGQHNIAAAKPGTFVKDRNGAWVRK